MTGACSLLIPRGQWGWERDRSQCQAELLVWHKAGRKGGKETARLGFSGPRAGQGNTPEKEGCQGRGKGGEDRRRVFLCKEKDFPVGQLM